MPPTTAARWMTRSGRLGQGATDAVRGPEVVLGAARDEDVACARAVSLGDRAAEEAGAPGDHDPPAGPEAAHALRRRCRSASVGIAALGLRSARSMIRTSSLKVVFGRQPSSSPRPTRRRTARRPRSAGSSERRSGRDPPSRDRRGRRPPRRTRGRCASRRWRSRSRRAVLLQHQPHRLDVLGRVAPVPLRVEVAQVELLFLAGEDRRDPARDLAGDEGLAAARALVVEEDAVAGEQAVASRYWTVIQCANTFATA